MARNFAHRFPTMFSRRNFMPGEAPDGCGNGIKSKNVRRGEREISAITFVQLFALYDWYGKSEAIISRVSRFYFFVHPARSADFVRRRTDSNPELFQGKNIGKRQRNKFSIRTAASFIPKIARTTKQRWPACARRRFNVGSRGPGAWQ